MDPYGVAQSYCEAPSKDWVLVEPAPYVEPEPYIANPLADEVVVLTMIRAKPYVVAQPYIQPEPYGASEVVPYSNGNAEQPLTFSEAATGGSIGFLTHITYGVEVPYVEAYPYVGLPFVETTYKATDTLTFGEEVSPGFEQGTDGLTFSEEAGIQHAASNTLVFTEPTHSIVKDTLTFSELASYVRGASNTLSFVDTSAVAAIDTQDALTFSETVSYTRNQHDVLAFSDTAAQILGQSDGLTFSETAAVILAASNTLAFNAPLAVELPTTDALTLSETVTWATHLVEPGLLTFTQVTTWNRTKQLDGSESLSFFEVGRYTTYRGGAVVGSGGTGYITEPPKITAQPKVTVGASTFRMAGGYDLETEFGNGVYLNAGDKYTLDLGRPLDVVGDWQLALRALVGTVQTVTNLLPTPFDVFITDDTTLDSEGMSLVFLSLGHDNRGAI